jgi:hypothetical protein
VLTGMLARVGLLLVVTGLTFIVLGWLDVVGPFLMIIGSGCAAISFERALGPAVQPEINPAVVVDAAVSGEHPLPVAETSGTNQAA